MSARPLLPAWPSRGITASLTWPPARRAPVLRLPCSGHWRTDTTPPQLPPTVPDDYATHAKPPSEAFMNAVLLSTFFYTVSRNAHLYPCCEQRPSAETR